MIVAVIYWNAMNPLQSEKKALSTIIIGGGISGLACAYELMSLCPEMNIRILEKSSRPGGVINTIKQDDLLLECGPESFSTLKPEVLSLAAKLQIKHRVISTAETNRRSFVSLSGKLHALPDGFMMIAPSDLWSFAKSNIFSISGKLRMAMDMILPANLTQDDESLSSFVKRRLGQEALTKLAEPMIGGIYGGDPEFLSASSTIPQLVQLEKKYGSIIRGLMQGKKRERAATASAGPRYGILASFDQGISLLVESILKELPENCVQTSKTVSHVMAAKNAYRWTVLCSDNSRYDADFVVFATPADQAGFMLSEINPSVSHKLTSIRRSPAMIVNLVYKRNQIKKQPKGFGFVVPRVEGTLISACSFSSNKFSGRSREDELVARIFTGGLLKADAMKLDDDALIELCHSELQKLLDIEGRPKMHVLSRYDNAIPQYTVGHSKLVAAIEKDLLLSPGIFLAGNSYVGVGLPDCIKSAQCAAQQIHESLEKVFNQVYLAV